MDEPEVVIDLDLYSARPYLKQTVIMFGMPTTLREAIDTDLAIKLTEGRASE